MSRDESACFPDGAVGGGDLSHETLGIKSHQEQEPGLKSCTPLTWRSTESELGPEVGLNKETPCRVVLCCCCCCYCCVSVCKGMCMCHGCVCVRAPSEPHYAHR
jgi:hypothetical protein